MPCAEAKQGRQKTANERENQTERFMVVIGCGSLFGEPFEVPRHRSVARCRFFWIPAPFGSFSRLDCTPKSCEPLTAPWVLVSVGCLRLVGRAPCFYANKKTVPPLPVRACSFQRLTAPGSKRFAGECIKRGFHPGDTAHPGHPGAPRRCGLFSQEIPEPSGAAKIKPTDF